MDGRKRVFSWVLICSFFDEKNGLSGRLGVWQGCGAGLARAKPP